MIKPIEIKKNKLILTEGADTQYFCIWGTKAYGVNEDKQVIDFGGISELSNKLKLLTVSPGFNNVTSLMIVRDAESNADSAFTSVKNSLKAVKLPEPIKPYEFVTNGYIKTAIAILPGMSSIENSIEKYCNGALEDLCMSTITDNIMLGMVDNFLHEIRVNNYPLNHFHKSRLHTYLAVKDSYVGMKIGEAAKNKAWDWGHKNMDKLKNMFLSM